MSVQGDDLKTTFASVFLSMFSRDKPVKHIVFLTQDEKLASKVKGLNDIMQEEGDEILIALLEQDGDAWLWFPKEQPEDGGTEQEGTCADKNDMGTPYDAENASEGNGENVLDDAESTPSESADAENATNPPKSEYLFKESAAAGLGLSGEEAQAVVWDNADAGELVAQAELSGLLEPDDDAEKEDESDSLVEEDGGESWNDAGTGEKSDTGGTVWRFFR